MAETALMTSGRLISTESVNGTDVFNAEGERLGTVASLMIDKLSGRAIYAMMSFVGSLNIDAEQRQLPWSTLKYDQRKSGYVVTPEAKMQNALPSYDGAPGIKWSPAYGHSLDDF